MKYDIKGDIFERNEDGMKFVTAPFILFIFICIILMVGSFISAMIDIFSSHYEYVLVKFAVFLMLLMFGIWADTLNWFSGVKYSFYYLY